MGSDLSRGTGGAFCRAGVRLEWDMDGGDSDKARQSLPGSWLCWESPFGCWEPFAKPQGGMGVVKPLWEFPVASQPRKWGRGVQAGCP